MAANPAPTPPDKRAGGGEGDSKAACLWRVDRKERIVYGLLRGAAYGVRDGWGEVQMSISVGS